jgi:hypothetical protein
VMAPTAPQDWVQQWAFPASAECLPVPSVAAHKGHLTKRNLKHARCFSGVQLTLRAVLEGVFVADRDDLFSEPLVAVKIEGFVPIQPHV